MSSELYDAIYAALNQYPGWDDSAVGYALKNNEAERRKIARAVNAAVQPIFDAQQGSADA